MARLLQYIFNHAGSRMIEDRDIMVEVFENYGLKCSKQRLWLTVTTLRTTASLSRK